MWCSRALVVALCLLWSVNGWAAPTVSVGTSYTNSPGLLTDSGSYTNAAGSNRVMILAIAARDSADTVADPSSAPTYGVQTMTLAKTSAAYNGATLQIWLYYLVNPASGANTWSITWPDANNQILVVPMTVIDANQDANPFSNTNSATASGSQTVNCTSAVGELVIDMAMLNDGGHTIAVGAGQTQLSNDSVGGGNLLAGTSWEAGAATTTMSWTLSAGTDPGGIVCAAIKPFVASTAKGSMMLLGVGQ